MCDQCEEGIILRYASLGTQDPAPGFFFMPLEAQYVSEEGLHQGALHGQAVLDPFLQ